MAREIRFRAWDIETKSWCKDISLWRVQYLNGDNDSPPCIIEQFTGLKDKNEKDIYEGDILSDENKMHGHLIGFVMFVSGRFIITRNEGNFPICDFEDCEVIGNIWETPELLK